MKWKVWSGRPYSPFVMDLALLATVRYLPEICPSALTSGYSSWSKEGEEYIYPMGEMVETIDMIIAKGLREKDFLDDLFKKSFIRAKSLNRFSKAFIHRTALRGAPTASLIAYVEDFAQRFIDMYSYATVMNLLGYSNDNRLYKQMEDILRRKAGEKYADCLLIATRPPKLLKNQLQDKNILLIAKKAKAAHLRVRKDVNQRFGKEIAALSQRYSWLSYDLCDSVKWDTNHYLTLVTEQMAADIEGELKRLKDYEQTAEKEFKGMCVKLKLKKDEVHLLDVMRHIGYYKWAREHEFIEALYHTRKVIAELGRRYGLSSLQSQYLLYDEWTAVTKGRSMAYRAKNAAAARVKRSLLVVSRTERKFYSGRDADRLYENMEFRQQSTLELQAAEVRGTPACAGKANGRVCIINTAQEAGRMREGDILVSVSTGPELVPVMRKAGAIVTDEGGVTCHAAIVARELRTPCVVGTKIATRWLKDGDMVEVDATNGVVRKL